MQVGGTVGGSADAGGVVLGPVRCGLEPFRNPVRAVVLRNFASDPSMFVEMLIVVISSFGCLGSSVGAVARVRTAHRTPRRRDPAPPTHPFRPRAGCRAPPTASTTASTDEPGHPNDETMTTNMSTNIDELASKFRRSTALTEFLNGTSLKERGRSTLPGL